MEIHKVDGNNLSCEQCEKMENFMRSLRYNWHPFVAGAMKVCGKCPNKPKPKIKDHT